MLVVREHLAPADAVLLHVLDLGIRLVARDRLRELDGQHLDDVEPERRDRARLGPAVAGDDGRLLVGASAR